MNSLKRSWTCLLATLVVLSWTAAAVAQGQYQQGTQALDERRWEEAVRAFDGVITGGNRADGALYWKAYALNKLGRQEEALESLQMLKETLPSSSWMRDAQALEMEIRLFSWAGRNTSCFRLPAGKVILRSGKRLLRSSAWPEAVRN